MKSFFTTSWLRTLVQLQFLYLVKADLDPFGYTRDGCYSGLDGFVSMGQSASMSSYYCMNLCSKKGYTVAAATDPGACYCGNSIPGTQLSSSACNFPCPAYPQEPCGGSNGAYNVFHVGDDVTTANPVSSSSSAPPSSSSSAAPATSTTDQGSSAQSTSDSKSTSPTPSQSSKASAGGTSATSEHSVQVSTATATVTNSVTAGAASSTSSGAASATASGHSEKKESGGGGLSGGAIAGIVVGVIVGLGAVAGIIAFILIRRRKEEFYSPQSSPSRFTDSGGFHGGYNANYPVIDQRLNPEMLQGDHRISIASLVDARDYSRQILKVVNPDDEKY